jgi:hypothetical protein
MVNLSRRDFVKQVIVLGAGSTILPGVLFAEASDPLPSSVKSDLLLNSPFPLKSLKTDCDYIYQVHSRLKRDEAFQRFIEDSFRTKRTGACSYMDKRIPGQCTFLWSRPCLH